MPSNMSLGHGHYYVINIVIALRVMTTVSVLSVDCLVSFGMSLMSDLFLMYTTGVVHRSAICERQTFYRVHPNTTF